MPLVRFGFGVSTGSGVSGAADRFGRASRLNLVFAKTVEVGE